MRKSVCYVKIWAIFFSIFFGCDGLGPPDCFYLYLVWSSQFFRDLMEVLWLFEIWGSQRWRKMSMLVFWVGTNVSENMFSLSSLLNSASALKTKTACYPKLWHLPTGPYGRPTSTSLGVLIDPRILNTLGDGESACDTVFKSFAQLTEGSEWLITLVCNWLLTT
jgi:hypothetical protein